MNAIGGRHGGRAKAIPRRVKQDPETVSAPVLHDFRVTLKRSVFISVFPQTVNCQTVTPGVNWRCPKKQEPVLVKPIFPFQKL